MTIRIAVVDDQTLFRETLRAFLDLQPDFYVAGEAANGEEALDLAAQVKIDVMLMDVRMPVMDGVAAVKRLHDTHPLCRVIMLSTFDDDEYVFEALRSGAVGYLLKDSPAEKLFEAIRSSARGESFLQPSIAARVVEEFARLSRPPARPPQTLVEPLTRRELEILRLVATGASNQEIAGELHLAEGTVKNHISDILGKLGVRDRTQAALKGRELGLV